jgi:hypothetical protein
MSIGEEKLKAWGVIHEEKPPKLLGSSARPPILDTMI